MGLFLMFPSGANLLTVGLLVVLEAMLSADNALVMAVIVLGLPRALQKKALRQGLAGAPGQRRRILDGPLRRYQR